MPGVETKVSVAGKRNFAGRDKGAETAPEDQGDNRRDMTHASNPANSALLAQSWEISVSEKVRGGGRSQSRTCLSNNSKAAMWLLTVSTAADQVAVKSHIAASCKLPRAAFAAKPKVGLK